VLVSAAAIVGVWQFGCVTPDLANRLRDDAFYEFAWAANVAAGDGPTVSTGVTTSGVQLLWSLLLVPFALLFGPAALPTIAPWLGALLHVATGAAWWHGTAPRRLGFALACLWLGHPLLLRECQNGQETALACLCASLLWLWRRRGERAFVLLGIAAVFARSELLLLVVAIAWLRHRWSWRSLLAPGIAAVLFLMACRSLGGGWLPDSAWPMAWLWQRQPVDGPGMWWWTRPVFLGGPFAIASAMGIGTAVFLLVRPWWPPRLRVVPAVAVGAARALGVRDLATPGWCALLLVLLPANGPRRLPRSVLVVFVSLAAIVVLHWAGRWYPRDYYLAPLVVVAMVAWQRLGRLAPVLSVAALAQLADLGRLRPEPLAAQRELQLAANFVGSFVPAGERIGCWNAGIVAYTAAVLPPLGERRGIVNLDGVVDARAFAALQRGELQAFLDRERVHFLLDHSVQVSSDPTLPHANGRFFGGGFAAERDMVELVRFDLPGIDGGRIGTDSVRLWWRRGRGAMPRVGASRWLGRDVDGNLLVAWQAQRGEVLEVIGTDGAPRAVLAADATTMIVVPVPTRLGDRHLRVRGASTPLLPFPPL
jgi:hypothetical protein